MIERGTSQLHIATTQRFRFSIFFIHLTSHIYRMYMLNTKHFPQNITNNMEVGYTIPNFRLAASYCQTLFHNQSIIIINYNGNT